MLFRSGSYDLSILSNGYLDIWLHIVVTRKGTDLVAWAGYSDNSYEKIIGFNTYTDAIPTNGDDFYIGSENAPDTYYSGLISNFRWSKDFAVYGTDAPTYPIALLDVGTAILLIGQGTDLTSQLTDQAGICTITNTNCTYNADSGISGIDGSIQFGTI